MTGGRAIGFRQPHLTAGGFHRQRIRVESCDHEERHRARNGFRGTVSSSRFCSCRDRSRLCCKRAAPRATGPERGLPVSNLPSINGLTISTDRGKRRFGSVKSPARGLVNSRGLRPNVGCRFTRASRLDRGIRRARQAHEVCRELRRRTSLRAGRFGATETARIGTASMRSSWQPGKEELTRRCCIKSFFDRFGDPTPRRNPSKKIGTSPIRFASANSLRTSFTC